MRPSTTMIFRWFRRLNVIRCGGKSDGRNRLTRTPPFLRRLAMDGNEYLRPAASMSTRTSTPRETASTSASANVRPVSSLSKIYVQSVMDVSARSMASSIAGYAWSPLYRGVMALPGNSGRSTTSSTRFARELRCPTRSAIRSWSSLGVTGSSVDPSLTDTKSVCRNSPRSDSARRRMRLMPSIRYSAGPKSGTSHVRPIHPNAEWVSCL